MSSLAMCAYHASGIVAAKRANKIVDAATPRTPPPKKRPSTTPQTAGDEEGASLLDRVGQFTGDAADATKRGAASAALRAEVAILEGRLAALTKEEAALATRQTTAHDVGATVARRRQLKEEIRATEAEIASKLAKVTNLKRSKAEAAKINMAEKAKAARAAASAASKLTKARRDWAFAAMKRREPDLKEGKRLDAALKAPLPNLKTPAEAAAARAKALVGSHFAPLDASSRAAVATLREAAQARLAVREAAQAHKAAAWGIQR